MWQRRQIPASKLTLVCIPVNGGPPGLIFGLIIAVFYYSFIGLSLAEVGNLNARLARNQLAFAGPAFHSPYLLTTTIPTQLASSVPTSGGVYHWATIAGGPRWGRILGFFTGWINFYGWMFDLAALLQITGNIAASMYGVYNQDTYDPRPWNVYVAYLAVLWTSTLIVIFANRTVPASQSLGMFLVMFGGIATIVVLAAMPSRHASNYFVWGSFDENNKTGWPGGVAFLLGVLNGAFTVGTPDSISHMAEELAHPKRDLPKAIGVQIGSGFFCSCSTTPCLYQGERPTSCVFFSIQRLTAAHVISCVRFCRCPVVRDYGPGCAAGRLQQLPIGRNICTGNSKPGRNAEQGCHVWPSVHSPHFGFPVLHWHTRHRMSLFPPRQPWLQPETCLIRPTPELATLLVSCSRQCRPALWRFQLCQ